MTNGKTEQVTNTENGDTNNIDIDDEEMRKAMPTSMEQDSNDNNRNIHNQQIQQMMMILEWETNQKEM